VITLIPWSSGLRTQADHFGDFVTVSDGERELTHRALAGRAARLAEMLLAADRGSIVKPLTMVSP